MSETVSTTMATAPPGQVIELPLSRPGEFIDISCDELPVTPAADLVPILYEERVPLQYYLRLAVGSSFQWLLTLDEKITVTVTMLFSVRV
jgi:hypothetical protein